MVLTSSYGATAADKPEASSVTVSPSRSERTPMLSSKRNNVWMSPRRGTLVNTIGSEVSSAAHKIGSAAFLAPEIVISPDSRAPPSISNLSIDSGRLRSAQRSPACRRIGFQAQGVDFAAIKTVAERGFHLAMLIRQ